MARGGTRPRLATGLVGADPASAKYVELKQRNARNVGIESEDHRLPSSTTTEELLALVQRLNRDEQVSGILIQQPAPKQVDMRRVNFDLHPAKAVDGFHPINPGLGALGLPGGLAPGPPVGTLL